VTIWRQETKQRSRVKHRGMVDRDVVPHSRIGCQDCRRMEEVVGVVGWVELKICVSAVQGCCIAVGQVQIFSVQFKYHIFALI